jgi:predicted GNAT family acetyltransferase
MADSQPRVVDNAQAGRFEIQLDGQRVGVAMYNRSGSTLSFTHTVIDSRFSGRGLGSTLAQSALDTVRAEGLSVLPFCPFIRDYMEEHPEYIQLVPPEQRVRFRLEAKPSRAEQ